MKRKAMLWLWGCLVAAMLGWAHAEDVRKTAEAGMLVSGSIEVNPDGTLHAYTLDDPGKLPPVVTDVIDKTVKVMRFTLSGAATEVVKARMNLRVIAKPVGEGNMSVSVLGASFYTGEKSSSVSSAERKPPRYPESLIRARVTGTAYLLLRVGRDGTVQDAIAEQVNLEQYDKAPAMERYRKAMADASLAAARQWTFHPPTTGNQVDDPYWVVRVPVNYSLHETGMPPPAKDEYGRWKAYIPGPRQTPPWISKTLAAEAPDAVPDGGIGTGDARLRLATPLGGA